MREKTSNWIHLSVKLIKAETDKAFLLMLDSGKEYWIPKSQIADADCYSKGDRDCEISVTEWVAKEKGIEEDDE